MREILSKSLALTLAATFTLVGACGGQLDDGDLFREAVPSASSLSLNAMAQDSSPGKLQQGLVGWPSGLAGLTKLVALDVNTKLVLGLVLLDSLTWRLPSSVSQDAATWGPVTPSGAALSYKLDVTRKAPGDFSYTLSAARAGSADPLVPVISGSSKRGSSSYYSGYSGAFTMDLDTLHKLAPLKWRSQGKIQGSYDTNGNERTVKMKLINFIKRSGAAAQTSDYSYLDRPDRSGEFSFVAVQDVQNNGSADESYSLKTRWIGDRSGRSDGTVSGGDLPAGTTHSISECWGSTSKIVYELKSWRSLEAGDKVKCAL